MPVFYDQPPLKRGYQFLPALIQRFSKSYNAGILWNFTGKTTIFRSYSRGMAFGSHRAGGI